MIIIGRGGGSLEDLWAFNDEQLARTIVQSPVPLVVGVGHETDFTIADFCADVRAATPTAAAELAAMPRTDAWQQAQGCAQRLRQRMQRQLDAQAQRLDRMTWGLARLARPVRQQSLHLHGLGLRLHQMRRSETATRWQPLRHLQARLLQAAMRHSRRGQHALWLQQQAQRLHHALHQIRQQKQITLDHLQQRWLHACHAQIDRQAQRLARCEDSLRLLHPQQVLDRGFALLQDETGRVLSRQADFQAGQAVTATVRDGQVPLAVRLPLQT